VTATGHDGRFGLETLPYGVFTRGGADPRVGVRIADEVLDLAAVSAAVDHRDAAVFDQPTLNALMALGHLRCHEIRTWVRGLLETDDASPTVRANLIPMAEVTMLLPVEVADYVDFYASETHASNVGKIFRPDSPDLPVSWRHLPIGYHGRSGTVVVSGTDVVRPRGQGRPAANGVPSFGPTSRLDIECEVGFVVGTASALGTSVTVARASDHIFGVVLLNDWSARDIQAWEYVPLGPFLGKSFATSISAWVVPLEAFADAKVPLPGQSPAVLPYLAGDESAAFGLDLRLTVTINGHRISEPPFRDMYWSPAQMLAHLTVNGASLRVGDLFGSGTVSGPDRDTFGSLLELTWNGTDPIELENGGRQGFLADGDVVTLTGWAPGGDGRRVTLGEVTGTIAPAVPRGAPPQSFAG
jgi:fumarylacetoacetase